MQRSVFSRVIGIVTILSLLVMPNRPVQIAQAETAATPDDEIIYIDSGSFLRVIDPNVAAGTQEITWSSPDNVWFDFATGDFNNDGDQEIVAIGGGKLTIFDPVVRDGSINPDGNFNLVPWVRLHERSLPNADIVATGNLDQNVPGDEIVVGYTVSEANGIVYRVDVLKTSDGGRTWTTHMSQGFGAKWTYIKAGNINNSGSDDLLLGRKTAFDSLVQAREVDNNFALIFSRADNLDFTPSDGAIGQVYGGGTGEAVLLRTFPGTSEVASLLIFQFTNGQWQITEDANNPQTDDSAHYFPHPFAVVTGDVNGNGDDEIIWLRDAPAGDGGTVRLVMVNRGNDSLPNFQTPLDADNGYRTLAMGDVDSDGRQEVAVMRNNRIRVFTAVETGNASLFDDYPNIGTNSRSLELANLDGEGYTAGARLDASPTSISTTLEAGTIKNDNRSIQLTNVGSGGNLPISVVKQKNSDWFSFSVGSGTTPANIFVFQFDASSLTPGTYTDQLVVTSSNTNVLNQPFYIPIELIVTDASFTLSPTSFGITMSITETMTQTRGVQVNGLPGLTFSAAIMSQPDFSAAVTALGAAPTRARFDGSGKLVLGNREREVATSVGRITNESRSVADIQWPSGVTWASATSAGSSIPGTITIAISPTLVTGSSGRGVLLVLGDERAGEFPDNLKITNFLVVKSDTPVFLPRISR